MIGKLIKEETFDPDKAAEAQIRFCEENEYPVFCPHQQNIRLCVL